ncbi:hypothetical protein [Rufibacter aurantiacus]|nr:hypothetical protein [Rufibacter aurantiacus]
MIVPKAAVGLPPKISYSDSGLFLVNKAKTGFPDPTKELPALS